MVKQEVRCTFSSLASAAAALTVTARIGTDRFVLYHVPLTLNIPIFYGISVLYHVVKAIARDTDSR